MTVVGNSTSAFYERSLSQMTALRGSIETLQTQIATGQKIERGSDDPAAAGRLRALLRAERLGDVEAENAAKLEQDLSFAADELGGVNDLLIRARELAVQAGSDTLGEEARAIVAEELEQLGEELFARANGTTL
ncbi:MAG: flagellar biosynthesis protein FlgL, partial [Pseudomonadota bacterium]